MTGKAFTNECKRLFKGRCRPGRAHMTFVDQLHLTNAGNDIYVDLKPKKAK